MEVATAPTAFAAIRYTRPICCPKRLGSGHRTCERHRWGGIAHGNRTRTPLRAAMRDKLQTTEGRAIYARRKAITEPVHGLIKQARGFRQFLLRGLDKVAGEFTLIALTHNLLKLWRAGLAPTG